MEQKRALVTGVTGQDGPYLAKFLLEKGYKVYGTYRRVSTPNFWRLQELDIINKIIMIPADLSDMSSLLEAVSISNPDEIYNLAAQSFVGGSFDQPILTNDIDATGTLRFLEIIRHSGKKIKFYQASTSELYGGSIESPQTEDTPMVPHSPYAVAKLSSYHMVKVYRHSYGIFACNGILFNHECISENTPIIIREKKTGAIDIGRIKDICRAREKGRNVQQWLIRDLEIWDGSDFVNINGLTATRRKKDNENYHCKTINTRHGIVESTNHHNMLLQDNTKVKSKEVKTGDRLAHGSFPFHGPISSVTLEEATFLGMMVGDGYINREGRSNFSNNNERIMEEFAHLWKKVALGTISGSKYETEYGQSVQAKLNGNGNYLRKIWSEVYTFDGFKKVPKRILNADKEIQKAFLIGYNLTDGLKSNRCTYDFRNFKTNSIILAQGLLFLVNQVTGQDFNITFEEDKKHYGYYSINLLSPTDNEKKEEDVKELTSKGYSQRGINRETGISRTFIRKIMNGGEAVLVHHLAKEKTEVKKMLYHQQQPEWVYDIETASGKLMAGVGKVVIANSPLRGLEFVTRKITNAVAKIKLGLQNELKLGNLHAQRDWGFAKEYVECMWMMMQHEKPDDYVVATGETHSVAEFCDAAFSAVGLNWKDYVTSDQKLHRPMDVHQLLGSPKKAERTFGWKPNVTFQGLVKIMVNADLDRWQKHLEGKHIVAWDAPHHHHNMEVISRNTTKDAKREAGKEFVDNVAEIRENDGAPLPSGTPEAIFAPEEPVVAKDSQPEVKETPNTPPPDLFSNDSEDNYF